MKIKKGARRDYATAPDPYSDAPRLPRWRCAEIWRSIIHWRGQNDFENSVCPSKGIVK